MEVLELRNNRTQGYLTLGVAIAALAVGLWSGSPVALAIGAVALLVGLWAVLDRRVKLRVDEFGIHYARWGYRPVQWAEIARIEVRTLRGVDQVCVIPRDPEVVLERMGQTQRWASWIAEKGWGCRFIISSAGLDGGTDELLRILRDYHRRRAPNGGGG